MSPSLLLRRFQPAGLRRFTVRHVAVAILAVGPTALPAQADDGRINLTADQQRTLGIVSQTLTDAAGSATRRLPAQVNVPPTRIAVISAPLAATVSSLAVTYGDTVKAGQPLLRLQGGQVLEAQRDHAILHSRARLASEALARDEALFAEGIIPASRLANARATAREAQAMLAERRQTLALAGAAAAADAGQLSGIAELRAPFAGIVLEAPAQPGQRVEAGTPLVRIGRPEPLWLDIQASAGQASGLRIGDQVGVPGCARPAQLVKIAPQLTPGNQAVLLRAELAKPADCVKPFQTLEVDVRPMKRESGRFSVPLAALSRHRDKTWLFIDSPGGFRPLPVTVLEESEQFAAVAGDGLSANTRIAVKGVAAIKAAWMGLGSDSR